MSEEPFMSPLWTSAEIATATGGTAYGPAFEADGIAFDSREIEPGDLFVAMKGETTDGHNFIEGAFERGAVGVICESETRHPHVRVADSAAALEALGRAARARSDAKAVGVTGSAGKTGTKEALFAALDRISFGAAHRSVKSYNNHVGVPLSLARMHRDTGYGVFEMGMNHSGELSALTRIVRPDVAIVTTVAPAHIGHFNDETEIADAKAEIFEGLGEGGTAILPHDNPHFARLLAKARGHVGQILTFGAHPDADVRVTEQVPAIEGGTLVTAALGERTLTFRIAHAGPHWVMNSLAVLAAVDALGGDLAIAGLALAELDAMPGRGARHTLRLADGEALLIDESYNANPASMAVTLQQFGAEPANRRIVVLGAMGELGPRSEAYHAELADQIVAADVARAILVGDEMQIVVEKLGKSLEAPDEFAQVADAGEALAMLRADLSAGDAVLVKGSNYHGLSKIVSALKGD